MTLERPPSLRLIGLTGGIGAGKSVVAACWRSLGIPVIDADAISRQQANPGGPAWQAIRDLFGEAVIDPAGCIDRGKVATRIFRDPNLRRVLEERLHPLVLEEVSGRLVRLERVGCPLVVVEAALIIETGLDAALDRVVVVTASVEDRIRRVCQRDQLSPDEVQARIAAQVSDERRLKGSGIPLPNDGPVEALMRRARMLALDLIKERDFRETRPGTRG